MFLYGVLYQVLLCYSIQECVFCLIPSLSHNTLDSLGETGGRETLEKLTGWSTRDSSWFLLCLIAMVLFLLNYVETFYWNDILLSSVFKVS